MSPWILLRLLALFLSLSSSFCLPLHEYGTGLPISRRNVADRGGGRGGLKLKGEVELGLEGLRGGFWKGGEAKAEPIQGKAGGKSIVWPVCTCVLYFISTTITSPALPSMANRIANPDGSVKVSPAGVELFGTLSSIDLAFTMLFTKLWGSLSDRYGRVPFMLLSSAGVSLGWLTVVQAAATHNMALLYGGRILDGVTSCMQPLCQSAVKDLSSPEMLDTNFGILQGAAWGGSFIIGGIPGGVLTNTKGPEFVMKIAAAVAAINVVITGLFAEETLPAEKRAAQVNWSEANPLGALTVLIRDRVTCIAAICLLLVWAALNGLQTNFFSYIEHQYGWGRVQSSILLCVVGIVISASQGLGPKLLSHRLGTAGTIKLGATLVGAGAAGMALAPNAPLFSLACLLLASGTLCIPLLTSVVASRAKSQESGAVLSALETAAMLEKVVACKGMAALLAIGMRHDAPSAFLWVSAGCCLVAVLLWKTIEVEAFAALT